VRFRIEQRFRLPLASVEDALCDPRLVERMADLPKLGRPQLLAHHQDGDQVHLQVRYAFAGDLSSAVRRVVDPAKLTWVQDSTIDRATHRTSFTILPDHYAGLLRCSGTFVLGTDGDAACQRVADGDMVVNVPLVGGKVERAIVSGLEEHAAAETELVEEWAATTGR
jgi:hypothetical protein